MLCICIALCNTTVFYTLSRTSTKKRVLVRRVSRSIINRIDCKQQYATAEELAFAKLMAFLCIIFILCWSPQMVSKLGFLNSLLLFLLLDFDSFGAICSEFEFLQNLFENCWCFDVRLFHFGPLRVRTTPIFRERKIQVAFYE